MTTWQPTASLEMLKTRACLLSRLRAFFLQKDVLEVQTPVLSLAGNTELAIASFMVQPDQRSDHQQTKHTIPPYFLNTSPEFSMKRLLAAGSGSIYQITPVFRQDEQGSNHNPEFTLLEWYRINFDHHALMGELDELIRYVAEDYLTLEQSQFFSYQDAMFKFANVDPFNADIETFKEVISKAGIDVVGMEEVIVMLNANSEIYREADEHIVRDAWLDLIMTHVVEKNMPLNCPVFIYDYPASQAALAKISRHNPSVAERFELYINGIELANGFHELCDAAEQLKRFQIQQAQRLKFDQPEIQVDYRLIAALKHGLPECAGVALGIDRLLMILTGMTHIHDVLSFPFERA